MEVVILAIGILIIHTEIRLYPKVGAVLPEHLRAKRMERADNRSFGQSGDERVNARTHFVARFGGESKREDPEVSIFRSLKYPRNACRQNCSFADARSSKHKCGSFTPIGGLPLRGAQLRQRGFEG